MIKSLVTLKSFNSLRHAKTINKPKTFKLHTSPKAFNIQTVSFQSNGFCQDGGIMHKLLKPSLLKPHDPRAWKCFIVPSTESVCSNSAQRHETTSKSVDPGAPKEALKTYTYSSIVNLFSFKHFCQNSIKSHPSQINATNMCFLGN